MTEIEPPMLSVLMNRMFLPPDQRDEKAAAKSLAALPVPLGVLDSHLKGREYLLGKDFTIADLNVASVLSLATFINLDFSATPEVGKWLPKCLARPSSQRAIKLK